ncbi:ecto-ADP-ribosyltransferase 5 [Caretta caretta]|uniref:ecto-ADP-ribosyltransferase 5 n=1 Tax=Caretta caretta TaxID=8467 RepID=UPI003D49C50E
MLGPLLIPLTYFCLHTSLGIAQTKREVKLSMMDDAFDDQYLGCAKKMDGIAPGLLEKEKSKSSLLRTVWEKAEQQWEKVKKKISRPRDFTDKQGIAIVAYTDKIQIYNEVFPTTFNKAVRENGTSQADYMAKFHFKAFHYYLTTALQLLRKGCDVTYNRKVYRGTQTKYIGSGDMRFGHFASSSIEEKEAEKFGTNTFFTIRSCFGVEIWKFSYDPLQKEVLIPVHETFNAANVQGSNHFVLQSKNQTCSYFNCAYLGGEKNKKCVDNSATRRGLAFPSVLSPSLFGGPILLVHVAALKLFADF